MHKFHVQNRKDTKLEINGTFYIWTWTENSWSDLNLQIWPTSVQFSLSFVCFFSGHKKGHKGEKWHADESMRPASHRPLEEKEVWVWVRADFKGRSSAPLRSRTKALWQHVAWGFFSFFLKKDVFPHFVLFFCCCCLLSMASDLRVFWCPCATACLKYISRKKKNNRGGKKVGRTLFCIFGLKSQLSGKQSSDCLVCLWNIFSFSSVTHTHISVWEHVCVLLSSVAKVAGCPPQPDGVLCEFGAGAAPLQFSCHQLALTALMSLTRFWARQIPKI